MPVRSILNSEIEVNPLDPEVQRRLHLLFPDTCDHREKLFAGFSARGRLTGVRWSLVICDICDRKDTDE